MKLCDRITSACVLGLWVNLAQADAPTPTISSPAAVQWSTDIAVLADDRMEGRETGTAGYLRAAEYVMERFRAERLAPAGDSGYQQMVEFEVQRIDQQASTVELVAPDGTVSALEAGDALLIGSGGAPRPASVTAPLVFAGYGLHLPDQGYDDFAGLDLRGRIVVVLSGGPAELSGPLKANARFARTRLLAERGAVGIIGLSTPQQTEIPWSRQKQLAHPAGMYLAAPELRETPDGFFTASIDPARAEALFAGSAHGFADLCALADAGQPLPGFALPAQLRATIVAQRDRLRSPNLVALLRGRDARLQNEFVVISAHLDHLGMSQTAAGTRIYNGAMDDASGVAAVLDIAHRLRQRWRRPRRSVLFVIFTGEEKGLLGSHYFAAHPSVPRNALVADLNFDMPLPLWRLQSVLAHGEGESTLGADARAVAAREHLRMSPDPLPDRNVFTRTDQYSFVREGIPALAFKFGFARDTPEFVLEHNWRATRYHSPSDDLHQPGIYPDEAIRLDTFVLALTLRIANADARPAWLPTSVFDKHPSD